MLQLFVDANSMKCLDQLALVLAASLNPRDLINANQQLRTVHPLERPVLVHANEVVVELDDLTDETHLLSWSLDVQAYVAEPLLEAGHRARNLQQVELRKRFDARPARRD